jgi:hypothetical protein
MKAYFILIALALITMSCHAQTTTKDGKPRVPSYFEIFLA